MDIVLMGGKGFMEGFDEAIKLDAKENGFLTPLGEKEKKLLVLVKVLSMVLTFRKYKTVDGHTITCKALCFL